jgi:hypothetical protein
MPDSSLPLRNPWPRRLIAIVLVLGIATAIVALNAGKGSRPPKLPVPNGYDDLARAGSLITGDWPNKGDLRKADPQDLRPFVASNQAVLDLARLGLSRECMVPLEDDQQALTRYYAALGYVRNVSRLLLGEGRLLEADQRFVEASRSYRDILALGQAISQGGMALDAQLGQMFQEQAVGCLRALHNRLPAEECRAILRDLDALDRRRVTLAALDARWTRWYQGSNNPFQRTMLSMSGVAKKGRTDERGIAKKSHDRIERVFRFFQVELAIHLYHEDKKAWPRSVAELVPAYLASAPIDSTTGQVVAYPPNAQGELTDDLGSIARPDGEVTPRP